MYLNLLIVSIMKIQTLPIRWLAIALLSAAVGKVISFPFRSIAYGVGAIVSSVPKGFVDGVYDAWTDWKDYDNPVENNNQQNQQNQQNN